MNDQPQTPPFPPNERLRAIQGVDDPFRRLVTIMDALLAPDGCPWDREQTHESLLPYLIEEAYEVQADVLAGKTQNVKTELGDVALQVVFHAALAKRDGEYDVDDVMTAICDKLIRRHPHVFGDTEANDAATVKANWEEIKRQEKEAAGEKAEPVSLLDGVPAALPALQRAQRIQDRAADVGFDWETIEQVWEKVEEEFGELREAYRSGDHARTEDELGDSIFALVNLSRFLNQWTEISLGKTIDKFGRRFRHIERVARERGRELSDMTLAEMDAIWEEAKGGERS